MTDFTPEQLSAWESYEAVRQSGAFNMFDPRAKEAAGLDTRMYVFVMKNYSALKAKSKEMDYL